ncbi:MAG TPA: hypothetical protein VNG93_15410 [Candidatus Dormibacteraeota bacterium]|nr:hypothetical protein [Candidatus Dormibacteraeota bacterium]
MAGPVVHEPAGALRRTPQFGNATRDDVPGFLGIMRIIHQEPNSSAFARLLTGQQRDEDEIPLAHLFEEISTLALHGLLVEDLLFDAFAFDFYWEALKGSVRSARERTGNGKFCENFELAAQLAVAYREARPSKVAK